MKKILLFAAAAMLAFAACEEKDPTPTPNPGPGTETEVCPDCGKNPCECTTPENDYELFLSYDVKLQHGINTNYEGTVVTVDGSKVCNFFGMTEAEFYLAMGSLDSGAQVNNTLLFGLCYQDAGEWVYDFTPSTSNNFGHWMTKDGLVTNWGADSFMFTENRGWWGYESLEAAIADGMAEGAIWQFTYGIHPDFYDGQVGDTYTATDFIFDQNTQKTCYITYNVQIVDYVDPEAGKYPTTATAGTFDIDVPLSFSLAAQTWYDGAYFTEPFETVKEKLGMTSYELNKAITAGEVVLTYTLPDGTTGNGGNVWLNANNGLTAWGAEDAAVCIEWFWGATAEGLYGHTCAMPTDDGEGGYYYGDAVTAAIGKALKATFTLTYGETVVNLNCATTLAE